MVHCQPTTFSVGIVTHRSALSLLEKTLVSLAFAIMELRQDGFRKNIAVYILDNSEDDGYRTQLKELVASIDAQSELDVNLQFTENRGFGAAHNQIARSINSELHLVLNPDVTFSKGALVNAIKAFEIHHPDILLPKILNIENKELPLHIRAVGPQYVFLRALAPLWIRKIFSDYMEGVQQIPKDRVLPRDSRWLFSGCCMFLNRKLLDEIGGFDEKYFLYFEDYDLSLRILSRGTALVSSDFSITHYGGGASRKNWWHRFLFLKSSVRFYRKNLIANSWFWKQHV
ncbi:glycosyltransferase [Microbulbifer hainanensis]|uniref:glycosyltransferase n=1 Tax=Microbulbifer hainanensis TaxID=2735675 RepID=UPI001867ED69|nr:glycosyltransferase [Microbulbifer hainanensis]